MDNTSTTSTRPVNGSVVVENRLFLQEIKVKIQDLGKEINGLLDQKLADFVENFELKFDSNQQKREKLGIAPEKGKSDSYPYQDSKTNEKQDTTKVLFVDKQFQLRESLLTTNHIRTIYNFFLAILVLLILTSFAHDLLDEGRINLSFELIWWCFGGFPIVITTWLCMFSSTVLLLYPAYNFWARQTYMAGYANCCFWTTLYAVYIAAMFFLPIHFAVNIHELPTASSITVVCEQVRLIMKVHAFVRENVPKALRYKAAWNHKDDEVIDFKTPPCPEFEKFLYFLFAPTLVYRDHYPSSALPGYLCLLMLFWGLLHAWHNAFAEMLRFGDRLFYKDWWNSTSYAGYYRTWNVVVHDWLYAYVYRDVNKVLRSPSRTLAALSVFFLSSIVHEYVFIVGFKFFYPVMFVEFFGTGVLFFFITSKIHLKHIWNIFMWFSLMIGNGWLMALYSMEWYARRNCPPTFPNYLDYLVPRSWTCQANASEIILNN